MDIYLTEEQEMLREAARDFVSKENGLTLMREMRNNEKGYHPGLWRQMAELGWQGLIVPEEYGGFGGDFLDLCMILEGMGSKCFPSPFYASIVLGTQAITNFGSEEQKHELLPQIVSGDMILTLAAVEPGMSGTDRILTHAEPNNGSYTLNGSKFFSEYAHLADYILCLARTSAAHNTEDGLSLFLVKGTASGVKCTVPKTMAYEKYCEVTLENVQLSSKDLIGEEGSGRRIFDELMAGAAVAKCAEMVGGFEAVLDMTVEYAGTREQFGKKIGSFQAVAHHCANMKISLDSSRYITYLAAWRIANNLSASRESAMAKAWVSKMAREITLLGHQVHGGVSFCEEHDMHLYYRKAKSGAVCFGTIEEHLEKVAREAGL